MLVACEGSISPSRGAPAARGPAAPTPPIRCPAIPVGASHERPRTTTAHPRRTEPPTPYRADGLIPPAGAARTWGLTVIGAPLLAVLLLGLVDGAYSSGGGAQARPWTPPTASYTYSQSAASDPYGASAPATTAPDPYGATEPVTTAPGTTVTGDAGGGSALVDPTEETTTAAADAGSGRHRLLRRGQQP